MTLVRRRAVVDSADMLELYKLTVEMADRISARRGQADQFYLACPSAKSALHPGECSGRFVDVDSSRVVRSHWADFGSCSPVTPLI